MSDNKQAKMLAESSLQKLQHIAETMNSGCDYEIPDWWVAKMTAVYAYLDVLCVSVYEMAEEAAEEAEDESEDETDYESESSEEETDDTPESAEEVLDIEVETPDTAFDMLPPSYRRA